MLSITHRITGVLLCGGALLLSGWLAALALGPAAYDPALRHLGAWYGRFALGGLLFSLYYHLCNGVRHLCWDLGLGLGLKSAYRSGCLVVFLSALLTLATLWAGGGT